MAKVVAQCLSKVLQCLAMGGPLMTLTCCVPKLKPSVLLLCLLTCVYKRLMQQR